MSMLARSAWLTLGSLSVPLDNVEGGWVCQELDLGYPDIRTVTDPNPEAHGTVDRTAYFGARTITAKLAVYDGGSVPLDSILGQFGPFLDVGARPELHYMTEGNPVERVLTLRATGFSGPMGVPPRRDAQLSWVAPFPLPKDVNVQSGTTWAGGNIGNNRTYPLTYPRQYIVGGIGPPVAVMLKPGGDVGAKPFVSIYGPISSPVVTFTNQPSGLVAGRIAFLPGARLDAGHRVDVDTERHTAFLDGDREQSVLNLMDWTKTLWPLLPVAPTTCLAVLTGTNTTASSQAVISWQDVYLT